MEIIYLDCVNSTQKYLINEIKKESLKPPIAIVSATQTDGIGSRENSWVSQKGNLFLSFAINLDTLPDDLSLASTSIYFGCIMRDTLREFGSMLYLKWPNDLYLNQKKIGGIITSKIQNSLICGIGINIISAPNGYEKLDIKVEIDTLLNSFFKNLYKCNLWSDIFKTYKIEFDKNRDFEVNMDNKKLSLKEAILNYDGSLTINGKKIYSLR